ncbi:MAG: lipopolysaccharide heptosyltransferase II [Gemmatimonas sp.]|uniref:lipopolysaccharide heptosyltransferase II n=1 Tax=Gemmatimonas sp. TaxID=1962908 RepID=UPI0025C43399|nr:lipopolysaccharide heptosyltransferase II [Gemmatimonas sp.]MCE2952784.1 lipopolysaccharide heptosyltransferase II [Gemmatimonas sp.]
MISAVLQTSFLGDMVLTTPLLERLAGEGRVHVVATPANAALLSNHPAVASVIVFDKRGADRGLGGLRRVARQLRAVGAQRAYLAQGSSRTAALAFLARIPERIGFDTSGGRLFSTRRVPFEPSLHHAARLWQLANAPGDATVPPPLRPSLFPGEREQAAVAALLAAHQVHDGDPLVALAPGSVWATKRWPSFDALAAALVRSATLPNARLVVLGAASDAPLAAAIDAAARTVGAPPIIDATGRLSLLGSAALLARCRVLVTNDSAPLHLASAMNTPTVALFGPTVPALGFGPLAERQIVVQHDTLPCRPCHAHGPMHCPLGHWRCMRDLSPAAVCAAAERAAAERAAAAQ